MSGERENYRYHCNTCPFETDVRVTMKDHAAVLGHFGWTDTEVPVEAGVCWCGEEEDADIHVEDDLGHPYRDVETMGLLWVTPMDAEGNPTGPPIDVSARVRSIEIAMPDQTVVEIDPLDSPFTKTFSLDVTFAQPDPNMLALFYGAKPSEGGDLAVEGAKPTFSIETYVPARRRTFWEWLRRKPKHLAWYTFIPNATLAEESTDE